MKKRFWLIDADMTLFDYEKAERFALEAVCAACGVAFNQEALERYHEINESLWRKLERGEMTQDRLRVERFERFLRVVDSDADPADAAERFVEHLGKGCYLFPQSLSLLQNLRARGCTVGILTNGITAVQKSRFRLSGLMPYVNALVISQEEGVSKPDRRIVERALEVLRCPDKADAVIVGDSLTSDMQAARNAQVDGIWYNPKRLPCPADNPYIRAEVTQLHDLIQFV